MRRLTVLCLIMLALPIAAEQPKYRLEIDLSGEWRLEIGDREEYAERKYGDDEWERVQVPNAWENEGFPGYDGYAWYRKGFVIPENLRTRQLYLKIGRVDDVDMTYFNGHLIGATGDFPPNYSTAWDTRRLYELPAEYVRYDRENSLAVRVYDPGGGGGIYAGTVGIYTRVDGVVLHIDLSGRWRFRTGDCLAWKEPSYLDTAWGSINVPGQWEKQGHAEYDGFAWYRRTVPIDRELAREKLILMAGKIDDRDAVYFNGREIGQTGRFPVAKDKRHCEECYDVERAYFIPPEALRAGEPNVIAVRVYDHGGYGGIWRGSIGITTREEYLRYAQHR
ncbi:MAG: glycoside hydrolase [Chitinivibrionales bacterium]|nr:glycoside hydrolase [Chitinivibrionales bacterium]